MLTYTTVQLLQQIQREYVKGDSVKDQFEFAKKNLCRTISADESKGDELFPMRTITHMATQQNRKTIDIIKENAKRYIAVESEKELIKDLRYEGYEIHHARTRDKVLKEKKMEPCYIYNLKQAQEIKLMPTECF